MTDQFLDYLRYERAASELTVKRYERSLRDFEAFFQELDSGLGWASADADVIRLWMEQRMDAGRRAATVNADLSALRSFYRFALSRGLVAKDPARHVGGPKKRQKLPQFVREAEMDELLNDSAWDNNYIGVRARTIILLLYEAGLRRAELASLDDADVDFTTCQIRVTGKRRRQRVIPFGSELSRQLRHYIEVRNGEGEARQTEALFTNLKGGRISGSQVYRLVHKALLGATALEQRSPHVLRHTFATALLNHNAGIENVRKLLGHQKLQTTQIYTHATYEQIVSAYAKAHPRAGDGE